MPQQTVLKRHKLLVKHKNFILLEIPRFQHPSSSLGTSTEFFDTKETLCAKTMSDALTETNAPSGPTRKLEFVEMTFWLAKMCLYVKCEAKGADVYEVWRVSSQMSASLKEPVFYPSHSRGQ